MESPARQSPNQRGLAGRFVAYRGWLVAVVCEPGWRGTSNNNKWDNHESSLSEAEMIELGKSIINLGQMNNLPTGTRKCFKDLAAALKTGTVTITKGIHQRDSKVHFDVQASGDTTGTFHVFVKTGEDVSIISPPIKAGWGISPSLVGKTVTRSLFKFVVSGLSYRAGSVDYLYPAIFTQLSEVEKPLGRARSSSFSTGNSTAVVTRTEMTTIG